MSSPSARRPREDPLLMVIDEVERARLRPRPPRRSRRSRPRAVSTLRPAPPPRRRRRPAASPASAGTSSTANSRSRTSRWCVTSWIGILVRELARAQERAAAVLVADPVAALRVDVDVAEVDVGRVVQTDRRGERRVAARHAIAVIVGDRDVLRPADLQRHGFRALVRLLLGLRRVEVPVLDVIELDLVEEVMLGRQLVDVARASSCRTRRSPPARSVSGVQMLANVPPPPWVTHRLGYWRAPAPSRRELARVAPRSVP